MSDDESSTTSGGDGAEITLFQCRRCPGQRFTAAERDVHRMQHKNDKDKKGKKGRGRGRGDSPTRSEVTLFEPIVVRQTPTGEEEVVTPSPKSNPPKATKRRSDAPGPASKKGKQKEKPGREKERRKRESVKRYDASVATNVKYPGA